MNLHSRKGKRQWEQVTKEKTLLGYKGRYFSLKNSEFHTVLG